MAEPKTRRTAGSDKLKKLCSPPIVSKTELAKALGVSTQTIWVWMRGQARPKFEHMLELEKLYGIDPKEWGEAPEGEASAEPAPTFQHPPAPAGTDGGN